MISLKLKSFLFWTELFLGIQQSLSVVDGSLRYVASAEHLGDFAYSLLLGEFTHGTDGAF